MKPKPITRLVAFALCATSIATARAADGNAGGVAIDFNRDVRPILAAKCLNCHGPDKQESGLRLDVKSRALQGGDSGEPSVVPGKVEASPLIARVTSTTDGERMPPEGEPLAAQEIELLANWIRAGAQWPDEAPQQAASSKHWAYQPPEKLDPPVVSNSDWVRNGIDRFVLAKLDMEKLTPSAEADRYTLIRRVSLDLTGLPPTPAEVEAFVNDDCPDAYERVVDRLLDSAGYGERWAQLWLDLARYADSQGYEKDDFRTIWRYRDWVINAFNANLPFDQFTIEQLAGDLLPDATLDQKLATAFHRNTMTNTEGGTDDEEFRTAAIVDRVNTTMQVWMGTTMGCAQCHTHKYDPITQREYYEFFAFFNNTADRDQPNESPTIAAPTSDQISATERAAAEVARLDAELAGHVDAATKTAIVELLNVQADKRSDEQKAKLKEQYEKLAAEVVASCELLDKAKAHLASIRPAMIPVMQELGTEERRTTNVLKRGNFLDRGEQVSAGTPAAFHAFNESYPRDRVGIATWLVDERNPLTARVLVNRIWEQYFGIGLVETSEDFGTQGTPPSNLELLDWLALEALRLQYDLKALHRLIVTSATYRQSSDVSKELLERDSTNRLLARGPRVRLDAETVRDQALAVGGLLSTKMLGPSVMPPQPDGVWQVVYSGNPWQTSAGLDKHRRGLYTFWRRTSPYPSMAAFDAPSREFCVVRRIRTNTPLQALVTLNDPVYVEAAQGLAARIIFEAASETANRAQHAIMLCLSRPAHSDEIDRLTTLVQQQTEHFRAHPDDARAMAGDALCAKFPATDPAELAAWTVTANVLLNLDEMLTKD